MFNNNNYLPDLNHYPPTGQQGLSSGSDPMAMSQAAMQLDPSTAMPSVTGFVGNFRFLSPTQVTAVPTWTPAATVVGTQSAPGMGTSWQHSVPLTMPWANPNIPHFTAEVSPVPSMPIYTMPVYTTPMGAMSQTIQMQTTPKSSVRCQHLKRRFQPSSLDDPECPSSKRHLSEKMAHWFKQLQIAPSKGRNAHHSLGSTSNQQSGLPMFDNGWQRFHEVEKRLEVDDINLNLSASALGQQNTSNGIDSGASSSLLTSHSAGSSPALKNGAVLTIPEELKKEVLNSEPVLPAQIMQSITNPCKDLVLWKPLEAIHPSSPLFTETSSLPTSHCAHTTFTTTTTASNNSSRSATISGYPNGMASLAMVYDDGMSESSALQERQWSSVEGGGLTGGGAFDSVFGSHSSSQLMGMTRTNGSKASMDSLEFFDCMEMDDDADL